MTVCSINCHTSLHLTQTLLKRELSFAWHWGYLSEIEAIKAALTDVSRDFLPVTGTEKKPANFKKRKTPACVHIKTTLNICFPKKQISIDNVHWISICNEETQIQRKLKEFWYFWGRLKTVTIKGCFQRSKLTYRRYSSWAGCNDIVIKNCTKTHQFFICSRANDSHYKNLLYVTHTITLITHFYKTMTRE